MYHFYLLQLNLKGMIMMSENKKRNKDRERTNLTSMQEVAYGHEFKMADRAGGYVNRKGR
jgi:hypothetical protein